MRDGSLDAGRHLQHEGGQEVTALLFLQHHLCKNDKFGYGYYCRGKKKIVFSAASWKGSYTVYTVSKIGSITTLNRTVSAGKRI